VPAGDYDGGKAPGIVGVELKPFLVKKIPFYFVKKGAAALSITTFSLTTLSI
jgi:hypothetical protein